MADPVPSSRHERGQRVLPFIGAVTVALAVASLTPGATVRPGLLVATTIGFLLTALAIVVLPWDRLPGAARVAPVLVFCASVGLLRAATVTSTGRSGFSVLLLLAIVWQASYGRRVDLVVTGVAVFATLAVPIVAIGAPAYPSSDWRAAIMTTFVGALIGTVVQRLVRELRRERALVSTVAGIGRAGAAGGDPRHSLCQATLDLTGARAVLLLEPDGDGLRVTEAVGVDVPPEAIAPALLLDALGEITRAPGVTLVRDGTPGDGPEVDGAAGSGGLGALGPQGWVHHPIARDGTLRVVLSVGWDDPDPRPRAPVRAALELLAAEAAAAVDRADLVDRLDRMARHDALTGLVNRRAWDELLPREVARSARTGQPLTVAILDLDHFKAFNDLYGHLVGDQMLKAAAGAWVGALRAADTLCRWGGEEFAVLMPDTPAAEARQVLERLAAATPMQQTLSAGFVSHVGPVLPEALMTGADAAVYRAKRQGRDRIEEAAPAPAVTLDPPIVLDHPR